MVSFLKFVVWLLVTRTATSTRIINGVSYSNQELPPYDRAELQSLRSEWTVGVDKAFKEHGVTLQEATDTEYALIPANFRQQEWQDHAKWYKIRWQDLPNIIKEWIKANPRQTASYIVDGVVFFAPTAASGPVLWLLGYTSVGPRAASFASFLQSKIGLVGGRSVFAFLQSAAMDGYGTAAVKMVTRLLAAALGSLGARLCGRAGGDGTGS
ncbi:hypothetical protein OCU04_010780 [Sclerotinia nivalis]|uniref:Uncharacterized protein n=1 Tax=Sclerotinia nivalis TaxID=352851 RepID=A0A9X0ACS3_9HELO|nr:hypothetical protein OCU04_010780 [Sclerotinia nivalis]